MQIFASKTENLKASIESKIKPKTTKIVVGIKIKQLNIMPSSLKDIYKYPETMPYVRPYVAIKKGAQTLPIIDVPIKNKLKYIGIVLIKEDTIKFTKVSSLETTYSLLNIEIANSLTEVKLPTNKLPTSKPKIKTHENTINGKYSTKFLTLISMNLLFLRIESPPFFYTFYAGIWTCILI